MEQNKYKILSEWLEQYPDLYGWLYFNVSPIRDDSTSLNSVSGENVLNQFLDGSAEKEMLFAIAMIKSYDTGTSYTNIDEFKEVEQFSKWIEAQSNAGNLPEFDGCIVNKIEVLESAPSASVDNEQGLIKYQFQAKINYLESKGE